MRAKHPKHCAAAFTDYVRTNASGPTDATGSEEKRAGTDPDPDADADVDAVGGEIEFLYKLVPGVAHRSFGLNVARMAGLPRSLVRRAGVKAREMELATANRSATRAAKAPDARESGGGDDAREGGVMRAAGRRKIGGHRRATRRVSENLAGGMTPSRRAGGRRNPAGSREPSDATQSSVMHDERA